jgi:ketosteroid isomerase-like protein
MTQTSPAHLRELARAHFDRIRVAWERGDVSGVDEVFSDDLVYHMPPFPDLDKAGLRDFITRSHQAFSEFSLEEDELVVDGDTTVQRWHCTGTYSGPSSLLPVPPTGRSTQGTGASVAHWRDGRIVELWHFGDWMGWLTGAGVIPPLDAAGAG